MNLVFQNRHNYTQYDVNRSKSFLKDWVMVNTRNSLKRYFEAEKDQFKKPLKYSSQLSFSFLRFFIRFSKSYYSVLGNIKFEAYIDPGNKFDLHDKFSQVRFSYYLESV